MRKVRIIIIALIIAGLISGITLFVIGYFNPKGAGIYVETNPAASVFIDSEQVGRTPYRSTLKSGEITIRLVPESFETPLAPYETKVNLVSGIETVVTYEFAETQDLSAGDVLSFEKVSKDETSIAVITDPESAQVLIDGQVRGFAPFKTSTLVPGEHSLTLVSTGYLDRTINIKAEKGYKLTVISKLAPDLTAPAEEVLSEIAPMEEEVEEEVVEMVKILPTGVGFLRVREEPSTLGEEIARVEPGETYKLISTDEDTGWYEIEFEEATDDTETKTGWISNQYAELVEEGAPDDANN
jgi:hypothetical protein